MVKCQHNLVKIVEEVIDRKVGCYLKLLKYYQLIIKNIIMTQRSSILYSYYPSVCYYPSLIYSVPENC